MLDDALTYFIPDYLDLVQDFIGYFGSFFAGGVLVCFLFWAIAFAVKTVFGWLNSWASARE